jgi:ubiquinol-cytochrome c reductase iron-sulfur subunit
MAGVRLPLEPRPGSYAEWWNRHLSLRPGYLVSKLRSAGDAFFTPEAPIGAWGFHCTGKGQYDWARLNAVVRLVRDRGGKLLIELPTLSESKTPEQVAALPKNDDQLADPKSLRKPDELTPPYARNEARSIKPEFFVGVGICTHLGCSPSDKFQPGAQPSLPDDWAGGFLCPCHGSTFDMAGRVYKNKPAPDNLEVPPHMYLSDTRVLIGEDKKA